ncbi:hypothetical protein IMZ48_16490 [Candidatus Bathyarchaeota archaeon]|nr:hypothetical protein [Candidatus Bathyarchaeota archaeon]
MEHCVKIHGTPTRASHRGWAAPAKEEATPDRAEPRPNKRKREANKEHQGPAGGCEVSAKRQRIAGNAASDGGTLCIDLGSLAPPGSPSLPPQPPNTSVLPYGVASSGGSPDPDPFFELTRNPWLSV